MNAQRLDAYAVVCARRVFEVARAGEGRPCIVLEAGLGNDLQSWAHVFSELSTRSTTIAHSRPGYGLSSPVERTNLAVAAHGLFEMLHALDVAAPYLLVGHSYGGLIAQACARLRPTDVAGFIALDAPAPSHIALLTASEDEDGAAFRAANADLTGAARQEFEALRAPGGGHVDWEDTAYEGPTHFLLATQTTFGSDAHKQKRRARALDNATTFPQARVTEVPCGHNIHLERPDAVLDAVDAMLAQLAHGQP